jgi:hypothetical protein
MGGRKKIDIFFFFLFLVISIFLSWSLLSHGFFHTHDGDFFVIRLFEFDKALKSGHFPPRWAGGLNYGYGVPLFNFFYPGSLYLAEFFHLAGFPLTTSLKIILFLSFPLSAFGMYLFGKKVWGNFGGVISGLFYLIVPYRFLDVYVRGQIGEIVFLTFVPFVFWSFLVLSEKFDKKIFIFGCLSLAILLISHNILVLIFTPVIFFYALFLLLRAKDKSLIKIFFLFFLISFCLSAFFLLPALFEARYVKLGQAVVVNFREHFPSFFQLLYSPWGYGYSEPGLKDGMSFQLGIAHQIGFLLVVFFLLWQILRFGFSKDLKNFHLLFFLASALFSVFLTLKISSFFWEIVPLLSQVQFPWRFNSLTIFSLSFLAGSLIEGRKKYFLIILIPLLFLNCRNYLRPGFFERYDDSYYLGNKNLALGTTLIADEVLPVWVEEKPQFLPSSVIEFISGRGEFLLLKEKPICLKGKIKVEDKAVVRVNKTFYPGWKVYLNGKEVSFRIGKPFGFIEVEIPKGEHTFEVKLTKTPIQLFSDLLFLLGLLLAFLVIK